MSTNKPRRMWINQPSTLQPFHKWHGVRVLAVHDYDNTWQAFFLSGPVYSMQVLAQALSPGWPGADTEPRL